MVTAFVVQARYAYLETDLALSRRSAGPRARAGFKSTSSVLKDMVFRLLTWGGWKLPVNKGMLVLRLLLFSIVP